MVAAEALAVRVVSVVVQVSQEPQAAPSSVTRNAGSNGTAGAGATGELAEPNPCPVWCWNGWKRKRYSVRHAHSRISLESSSTGNELQIKSSPPIGPSTAHWTHVRCPLTLGILAMASEHGGVPMNKLCRRNGWRKFLYTRSPYQNHDLHDQLLSKLTYYDGPPRLTQTPTRCSPTRRHSVEPRLNANPSAATHHHAV